MALCECGRRAAGGHRTAYRRAGFESTIASASDAAIGRLRRQRAALSRWRGVRVFAANRVGATTHREREIQRHRQSCSELVVFDLSRACAAAVDSFVRSSAGWRAEFATGRRPDACVV